MSSGHDSDPPEEADGEIVLPSTTARTLQLPASRDRTRAFLPQLALRVVAGPDSGALHQAGQDRVVIGVHPKADFVLTDRTVSRFHCELAVAGDRVTVRDLGSGNGTLVNGVAILSAYLSPGARLTLGNTEIELGVGEIRWRSSCRKTAASAA